MLRDLCKTPPFASRYCGTLGSNFNPQNTQCIPVVKIFACLELESRYSGKHFSKVSMSNKKGNSYTIEL
jgi:hypothetical protein